MVPSREASSYSDRIDPAVMSFLPQWHHLYVGEEVLPNLREHSVTEEQLDAMLVETPRRYLETASPY
jgi:phosphotriesterase-related protein